MNHTASDHRFHFRDNVNKPLGSVYTKRQNQHYDNSAMMLAILFSLKAI